MPEPTLSVSAGSAESGPHLPPFGGTGVRWRSAVTILALALLSAVAGGQSGDQEPPETPHQKALREVATAGAASLGVSRLSRHPDYREAVSRDGELETVLERARRVLRAAESGLASAEQTQSLTGFSDSALLAKRATSTFEQCAERLRELFRQIEVERSPPPPPPPPVEPKPSPTVSETSPVAQPPDPGASPSEPDVPPSEASPAVPDTSPVARQPDPGAPPPEPVVEPSPASRIAPPPSPRPPSPPAPRRAPRKLRQAADAYFAGDYAAAVTLLSDNTFTRSKSRAHALLLRAAARYALFLLAGETDYAQRGQAAADVAACKAAVPDLAPDEDLFSPRFRDFFAATR